MDQRERLIELIDDFIDTVQEKKPRQSLKGERNETDKEKW